MDWVDPAVKRALFIVSDDGNGHRVRCGALATELERRGWLIVTESRADLVVIDGVRERMVPAEAIITRIIDIPGLWPDTDLLVCGSAGATPEMFKDSGAKRVLAGPEYALLRPEFRRTREFIEKSKCVDMKPLLGIRAVVDLRDISGLDADDVAYRCYCNSTAVTYGGMRAMEAACVMGSKNLEIHPRNPGEELNAKGLRSGAMVDGLGVKRVADAIEELFR